MKDTKNKNEKERISRRQFIKKGGQVVGGYALASQLLRPDMADAMASNTAPRKIRIGIVGGGFGASFQWHEHPDCIVEAVSDLREDRRKVLVDTYKCSKVYNSLEKLVKDKNIDAVAVFTEAPNHVKHTVECMKHGKHVIAAVPAAYATIEEAEQLLDIVKSTGLTYMLCETTYYRDNVITAREMYNKGDFGNLFYCEAEYVHYFAYTNPLFWHDRVGGKKTWRFGLAPMHYPTHTMSHLIAVTGERLTEVTCIGVEWSEPKLKDNIYNNPFGAETAFFKTSRGIAFRAKVWWDGAFRSIEQAQWMGSKTCFFTANPHGQGPVITKLMKDKIAYDDAGFAYNEAELLEHKQKDYWKTDMLPEPMRHDSGHYGSHTFLTHEFIDALVHNRKPVIDVYEALAYTVPGIIAHQSALKGGESMKIPQYDPAT